MRVSVIGGKLMKLNKVTVVLTLLVLAALTGGIVYAQVERGRETQHVPSTASVVLEQAFQLYTDSSLSQTLDSLTFDVRIAPFLADVSETSSRDVWVANVTDQDITLTVASNLLQEPGNIVVEVSPPADGDDPNRIDLGPFEVVKRQVTATVMGPLPETLEAGDIEFEVLFVAEPDLGP